MQGSDKLALSGGRMTQGVYRKGELVFRPCCGNFAFVHEVLIWLEGKNNAHTPRYVGISEAGEEITTYLAGETPDNLGDYLLAVLYEAGKIIRSLHDALSDFPACKEGTTVCHNDLSPCNFRWLEGLPYAVFDWDAAQIGEPLDDLAYALWMWCDIGNDAQTVLTVSQKIQALWKGYWGKAQPIPPNMLPKVLSQMSRVGASVFPSQEQTASTRRWAESCGTWLRENTEPLLQLLCA